MHPACEVCRGACCESLLVPVMRDKDSRDFFATRGSVFTVLGQPFDTLELPTPCRHLDACGKCGVYESRPQPCRTYEVGSKECRLTVKRRRTEKADMILALIDALTQNDSSQPNDATK